MGVGDFRSITFDQSVPRALYPAGSETLCFAAVGDQLFADLNGCDERVSEIIRAQVRDAPSQPAPEPKGSQSRTDGHFLLNFKDNL